MGKCKFENTLNRLRKSSSDSIDNTEIFDEFKKYMHVTRSAEDDLKELLRNVNSSGKKSLVLLCGSAGDGKSHLLSYLKNYDEENLLENYTIYNDATESSSPLKTAIDTLNDLLEDFRDTNINRYGNNIILAINLGVLSNFIESEYGVNYSLLRNYVADRNILSNKLNIKTFDFDSHFHHVSFSDYHMYSLNENGIHAGYIEEIFDKIFNNSIDNPFYYSYLNSCGTCPLSIKCPIKANYELYSIRNIRKYVAELLIKSTIEDKLILTTREILNFIYDSLISKEFNYSELYKLIVNDMEYLKNYINQITPNLLFDSTDVSVLMNTLKKYDPLLVRSEHSDEEAISFYVSSNVSDYIKNSFDALPYGKVVCDDETLSRINLDKSTKSSIYNTIVRIDDLDINEIGNDVFDEFIKYLYYFNSGQKNKLGGLYSLVENALVQWCGSIDDGLLCLDDNNDDYAIYEKIIFIASVSHIDEPEFKDELFRFRPSIIVAFEDKSKEGEKIFLDIDFSLFSLLYKLNKGYIQTADDRNNHADFISFINRILQSGKLNESITIMTNEGNRVEIMQNMFGYKFKVVK